MRIITTILSTFIFLIGIAISPIFVSDSLATVSCECTATASAGLVAKALIASAKLGYSAQVATGYQQVESICKSYKGAYTDNKCSNAKVVFDSNTKDECEKMALKDIIIKEGYTNIDKPIPSTAFMMAGKMPLDVANTYLNITYSCRVVSVSGSSATGGSSAPAGGKGSCTSDKCTLSNPLGNVTEVPVLIGTIVKGVLGLVGALALFFFFQGGFSWMTSAGSPERVKKGRDTLMWASIGLIATFASYAFLKFILDMLTRKI